MSALGQTKTEKSRKALSAVGWLFHVKNEKGYVLKLDVQNMTGDYLLSQKKEKKEL